MLRLRHASRPLAAAVLLLVPTLGAAAAHRLGAQAPGSRDAAAISAPVANVRYEVTYDSAAARDEALRVSMTFDIGGDGPVLLSLPAWTPGAYELTFFARWVTDFTATADGRPLEWEKADHDTWRIRPAGARRVTVRFAYTCDTLDNAMTWLQPDFAFFNGTNVFLYPEGRGFDWGATVAVRTGGAWRVATGMEPAGAPNTFRAANYHDLVDMPFFVGRFDLDSAEIAGKWMRLATYPRGSVSGARRDTAWSWLKRMTPSQVAVFGEVPWRTYTVMQVADSAYGGASGLEHQNSHLDIVSALALDNPAVPSLWAHEIFHAWNVKRLRPAELWPYRYDAVQPTPLLWVSEGITDYYADVSEARGGIVDSAGFLELLTAKINQVRQAPPVALEDASLSTWVKPADGTGYLYYPKGALAGLLLDILIRDASDNRRSLDDVLRELYAATYKRGQGFTDAQFWAAATRAAGGKALDDVRRRYVDGREPYPWDTVLPLAGLRLAADTAHEPQLGIYSMLDSAGVRVMQVAPGSGAERAGVRPGDYLLEAGELPILADDFGERFRAKYADGQAASLPLKVRRDGQELTLAAPVTFARRVTLALAYDPVASPKAVRIRDGILRGRTGG